MVDYLTITPQTLPTVTSGNDYTVTITLQKDGATYNITGDTVTVSIHDAEHPETGLINDVCVPAGCRTCACGIITLKLTDTQTASLRTPHQPWRSRMHIADVKVVQCCCAVAHSEPFFIPVRRAIT